MNQVFFKEADKRGVALPQSSLLLDDGNGSAREYRGNSGAGCLSPGERLENVRDCERSE